MNQIMKHNHFDEAALVRWMSDTIPGFEGPLLIKQFKDGQSNPTYCLHTPQKDYVLRRKPTGILLKGAHAIEREARVLRALKQTDVPVPNVYALCTDASVIGSWFYIMDMVEGRIFWDSSFPEIKQSQRYKYFDAMNSTIAKLHNLDPVVIGLGDYGHGDNYLLRQINRWSTQYYEDKVAGQNLEMDLLAKWLPEHIPANSDISLVHGDFRIDNMIFHPHEPRIIAVIDWELSTLGDPLSDFAYHVMMYRMPRDILGGLVGVNLVASNLPNEDLYVHNYCLRTGRTKILHLDYYIIFNMFRFAAILHGIRGRIARGTAVSLEAEALSSNLERVALLAWKQVKDYLPKIDK